MRTIAVIERRLRVRSDIGFLTLLTGFAFPSAHRDRSETTCGGGQSAQPEQTYER
jgi:hypothetical protein